ncbi:hypothetical protein BKH41_03780 [Helicobacter sp. 12S02232-10]|uniref:hypothetical protein n=1 Tax=Helicobacter sp. 12S02232-10 TaxID=1476197 RepID=UPI000BA668E1|nr:hypothetical protein [Helicobacter sp. 12S02232-10]PAF49211.1 hypothetical protein BKH41_03780 [Helicobacter sp. 12S02232-10]
MLNQQILLWCGALLISLVLTGFLGVKYYIHQKIQAGIESGIATYILQTQNQAIRLKELQTKEYQEEDPKIKEKIITKYQVIQEKDLSCENQLKEIKNALELFYNPNSNVHP